VQLHRLVPTVVGTLQHVEIKKTASMSSYSVAIDTHGAVYVWGTGGSAGVVQSSKTDIYPQLLEALPLHAKVVDVSCGLGHALFLLQAGRVYSWGNGGNGRLGLGDVLDRTEACPVSLLDHEQISAVQCGASHSMALTSAGRVYSWGKNTQGQCGHGSVDDQVKPAVIRRLEDCVVVQLAAGWEHSLALTDEGRMYSWGCGYKDSRRGVIPPVLGLGHNEFRLVPELISSVETVKVVKIACGWDHCLALDDKGRVLSWGSGQNGKLGMGSEDNVSIPCYIPLLGGDAEEEELEQLKSKNSLSEDEEKKKAAAAAAAAVVVVHLAAGCEHTAVLTATGELFTWGHGDGGRLGQGTNAQCFVPSKVQSVEIMGIRYASLYARL
jgi:alpha-tubulin suppressor-like RCC1 family protein